ncbi:hypothetical protein [Streptomyces triticirhizae]|uniref:hypothetical protein n=1 Tax=Streptomyces triticirhizae TaxID=2483353 RepID=UPI0026CE1F24
MKLIRTGPAGRETPAVPLDGARAVAGHAISDDVSERVLPMERGGQWDKDRNCETFNPRGVGAGFDPPRFARPGDEVAVAISGLGAQRGRFERAPVEGDDR